MKWVVRYLNERQIKKAVRDMRPSTREAFVNAIQDFENEGPRPAGWITAPLKGDRQGQMKLKLDRNHRLIYTVMVDILTITLVKVGPRGNVYH